LHRRAPPAEGGADGSAGSRLEGAALPVPSGRIGFRLNRYNLSAEEVGEMKIILGTFQDNGEELAEFLEPRVGAKPQVSGGEITVDDDSLKKSVKARHVKTYVKRFLWKKGERQNYRVLVEGKELRLIELEPSEAEKEERKQLEEKEKEREKEAQSKKKDEEEEEEAKPETEPAGEEAPAVAAVPAVEQEPEEEEEEEAAAPASKKKQAAPKDAKKRPRKGAEKEAPASSASSSPET